MDDQSELLKSLFKEQIHAELDLLSQRVKAEQETAAELRRKNDLEEQALRNLERSRQVEIQRNRLWLEISERTATIVQQLPEMAHLIYGYDEKLGELEELSERLDRIERALVLLLSGSKSGRQAETLARDIEQDHRRRLLEQYRRRLEKLELKRASFGDQEAPAHLLMDIEDVKNEIEQLKE